MGKALGRSRNCNIILFGMIVFVAVAMISLNYDNATQDVSLASDVGTDATRNTRKIENHSLINKDQTTVQREINENKPEYQRMSEIYSKTCQTTELPRIPLNSSTIQDPDIALVIIFNHAKYASLEYNSLLYLPFFPRMIFCGPELPDRETYPGIYNLGGKLLYPFVTYGKTPDGYAGGSFNYACVKEAISAQPGVAGYLMVADDMILSVKSIQTLNKNAPWYIPYTETRIGNIKNLTDCIHGDCRNISDWPWWKLYQNQTIELLNFMSAEKNTSTEIYKCYNQLKRVNGAPYRPSGGYSDIFYIPSRLAVQFAELSNYFNKYHVFLEIAIPTMLRCLVDPESTVAIQGTRVWYEHRYEPWMTFHPTEYPPRVFFHPAKWSGLKNDTCIELRNFYCNTVLPFLHESGR